MKQSERLRIEGEYRARRLVERRQAEILATRLAAGCWGVGLISTESLPPGRAYKLCIMPFRKLTCSDEQRTA